MRFALLGDHPDGLEFVSVLRASGRHQLVAYTVRPSAVWRDRLGDAAYVPDAESILADPSVDVVIVAGLPQARPEQLRRAMQSERHVLCVHPPDAKPDIGYEASLVQKDTGYHLLPLIPDPLHPALKRFASLVGIREPGELGSPILLELEWASREERTSLFDETFQQTLPIWFILREVGGRIQEVAAYAPGEEFRPDEPILVQGMFEQDRLFRVLLEPGRENDERRLRMRGRSGHAELYFPSGFSGTTYLTWTDAKGESHEESWDSWDPWTALLPEIERGLQGQPTRAPDWEDCLHALELDDAARRSVRNRRASLMEYPEATEEVSFKGTMVLAGCTVLWTGVFLLFASLWVPNVRWLIVPLVIVFLLMQFLKYVIPKRDSEG